MKDAIDNWAWPNTSILTDAEMLMMQIVRGYRLSLAGLLRLKKTLVVTAIV